MIVIIGSGLTALSAGYKLEGRKDFVIFEKEKRVGGLATSITKDNFIFDYSGHLLHLRWNETKKFVFDLLKENLLKLNRNAKIYLDGNYVNYPFQINLYNLPLNIKSECVRDFLKAQLNKRKDSKNFRCWALNTFGKSICKYFMFPYNEKLFSHPLDKMSTAWLGNFVPRPDINTVLKGAYQKNIENIGYNPVFYYPKYGGIKSLTDKIASKIKKIETDSEIVFTDFKKRTLTLKDGTKIKFKELINTAPLKKFILNSNAPDSVIDAAKKLRHNRIYIINMGIKKTYFKEHWIYFPQKRFSFYRVGFYTNFSKNLAPYENDSIYIEISTEEDGFINIEKATSKIIKNLKELKIIKNDDDIKTILQTQAEFGYVIYDLEREKSLKIIFDYLKKQNVISTGRYGGWKYSFMEENIKDGFEAADILFKKDL